MSLDVFRKAADEVAAVQAANSKLKSEVGVLSQQVSTLQAEVNKADAKVSKAVAEGEAASAKLKKTIEERGNALQDALNTLAAVRAELKEVKQANAELTAQAGK